MIENSDPVTQPSPASMPTSTYSAARKPYAAGFASAMAIVLAAFPVLQQFTSFRVMDSESYVSLKDINDKYYQKDFVQSRYVDKAEVASDYVTKDEMSRRLAGMLTVEEVKNKYVSIVDYDDVKNKLDNLEMKMQGIPNPFKPRKKTLSASGQWRDDQLGVKISVLRIEDWGGGTYRVSMVLELPDSPEHQETFYSSELAQCNWTFMKNNREFELKVEGLSPLQFSVREIPQA